MQLTSNVITWDTEVGGACSTYVGIEKYIREFGGDGRRKETT